MNRKELVMFTLKVRTVSYNFTADVVVKDAKGTLAIAQACGESAKRSVRAIRASITDSYENDGLSVIAIDNIATAKVVHRDVYKVDASGADVVQACIDAGLTVERIDANTPDDSDDSDDSDR